MATRSGLIALALTVLAGCAPSGYLTLGQMPVQDPVAVIKVGVTTRSEILEMFGPPDLTGLDEDGLPRWTWTRGVIKIRQAREAELSSFFNLQVSFSGDLVDSYSYSRKAVP